MKTTELKAILKQMQATSIKNDTGSFASLKISDTTSGAVSQSVLTSEMYDKIKSHAEEVGSNQFMGTYNSADSENYRFARVDIAPLKLFDDIIELLPKQKKDEIRTIVDFYPLYLDKNYEEISATDNMYKATLLSCAANCIDYRDTYEKTSKPEDKELYEAALGDYYTTLNVFRALEDLKQVTTSTNDLEGLKQELLDEKDNLSDGGRRASIDSDDSMIDKIDSKADIIDRNIGLIDNYLQAKQAFDEREIEFVDKPSKRLH